MDPWIILGIAASILQFVDVGYKLVSGTKEIYCSAEGLKRQTAELRDLANDIQQQNEQILSSGMLSKDEKALKSLAEGSLDVAQKLDTRLTKLVVPGNAKFRRLQSVKVSVKAMIQQKDLEELKKRLLDLQNHVQQRLSIILQAQQNSDLASTIRQLQGENNRYRISTHRAFTLVFNELSQLASTRLDDIQNHPNFLPDLSSQITLTIKEGQKAFESRQIIGSLWFNILKDREDGIEKAYGNTLGWLFKPNETNFCNWLEHGDGIFWINGLAGSGKSTLMKFAFREKRTITLLEKWSNGRKLHIASFFFWNSGSEMQKSQRGLFQSLLCQIFQSDPDLVTIICPTHHHNEPWNTDELKDAYEKLHLHTTTTSAFCFFIDGLDEYSGDETEIIDILKTLSQLANVKICAASRPWNAFERAFSNQEKILVVEEHTMDDMKLYVRGMLEENLEFTELISKEPCCAEFVPEIARRAKGVWLWVYLVVKDLTKDIEGKEGYEFLKKRLDNIPPRLEAYFEDIINRVDPIYKDETAQIFLLTIEAVQPLPLFALYFLEMERRDSNYAMKIDLQNLKDQGIKSICNTWRIKLKSRCRDLLKPQLRGHYPADDDYFSWQIEFLHRTVRDFLLKNYEAKLYEAAPKGFDAKVSLCRATLSMLQLHVQVILASGQNKWKHCDNFGYIKILFLVYEFLYYSFQLELLGKGHSQFSAIDTIEIIVESLFQDRINPWESVGDPQSKTFLSLLVTLGLDQYVCNVLDSGQASLGADGSLLLHTALMREFNLRCQTSRGTNRIQNRSSLPNHVFAHAGINLDFIGYLLRKGANVHQSKALSSFVGNCLLYKREVDEADCELWFKASKLLLQYGARLNEPLDTLAKRRSELPKTVREGMYLLFSKEEMDELERVAKAPVMTGWSFRSLPLQRFRNILGK